MRTLEVFRVHLDASLVLSIHNGSSHQGCPVCLSTHPLGVFLLKGAQAAHAGESKCHGCVRHEEKCAFLGTGKAWGAFVEHRLLLRSQWELAWFQFTQHYKLWRGPCHPPLPTASVTHLRVVCQHLLFHFREQRPEEWGSLSCHPALPGAGHAAWAAQGHRALPCGKQPALATVPGSAPQIFHSVPCSRVVYTLWEAARPDLFSLHSPHGGTMKPTITFFCNPAEFCWSAQVKIWPAVQIFFGKPTLIIFPLFHLACQIDIKVFTLLIF